MPYLSALEVCLRQGAIQIHVYLYLFLPKVEDWNWETIFTDIISLYSTNVTYLASKAIEFGEKRKIKAIKPFRVIQDHRSRYQSKARMRLPING